MIVAIDSEDHAAFRCTACVGDVLGCARSSAGRYRVQPPRVSGKVRGHAHRSGRDTRQANLNRLDVARIREARRLSRIGHVFGDGEYLDGVSQAGVVLEGVASSGVGMDHGGTCCWVPRKDSTSGFTFVDRPLTAEQLRLL